MISVSVRTTNTRKTVNCEITATPKSVFDSIGVDVSTSMINLNGAVLRGADLNDTFENLHIEDGTTVNLNAIVKADGAR